MAVETKCYKLDKIFTLHDYADFTISICALTLVLTSLEVDIIECRLIFQIDLELLQYIETKALFNLNSEMRVSLSSEAFSNELDIQIEVGLQPDFFSAFDKVLTNLDEASTNLLKLNQEHPNHPLFFTENWQLLTAKQQQVSGQVGYRTLQDYLSPAALVQTADHGSEDPTTDALVSFFKDWTNSHLSIDLEQAASELLKNLETAFTDFGNTNLADIEKLFTDLRKEAETQRRIPNLKPTLLEQVFHFFTTEDWQFTKLQGEPTLAIIFQGEQGQWRCYAKIREVQHQFVFYSVCPISAPTEQRPYIAEFLTRANYGMTIGNFELDFTDGEIRYKTSIDVESDRLTSALIKNLVYTNVSMMDEYLPGIKAVVEDDVSPVEAVRAIEQPDEISSKP